MAAAEKQLEAMAYRLTEERGRWSFLTPTLENATDKTRENAPLLNKQIWEFLEGQLEVAESRDLTEDLSQRRMKSPLGDSGGNTRRAI